MKLYEKLLVFFLASLPVAFLVIAFTPRPLPPSVRVPRHVRLLGPRAVEPWIARIGDQEFRLEFENEHRGMLGVSLGDVHLVMYVPVIVLRDTGTFGMTVVPLEPVGSEFVVEGEYRKGALSITRVSPRPPTWWPDGPVEFVPLEHGEHSELAEAIERRREFIASFDKHKKSGRDRSDVSFDGFPAAFEHLVRRKKPEWLSARQSDRDYGEEFSMSLRWMWMTGKGSIRLDLHIAKDSDVARRVTLQQVRSYSMGVRILDSAHGQLAFVALPEGGDVVGHTDRAAWKIGASGSSEEAVEMSKLLHLAVQQHLARAKD